MITIKFSKTLFARLCLIGLVLSVSGCVNVGLKKAFPDIKTYAFELKVPHTSAFSGAPVSLRVNAFSAAPFFNDRYMAYRSGETTYEQDFYNQLIAAPSQMVRDEVATWLKGSPLVAVMATPEGASEADYVIDGRLLELSGDYRVESTPKAVLQVQLTLSGDQGVLCQKIYTAEIPMKRISPVTLTEGWSQGLDQIMKSFEADLAACLVAAAKVSE